MADRYWVGGSGTWDNSSTANWAATTGGASGASAPTNADNVFFDTNSGTAATVTVAATAVSLSTTVNKSDINLSLSGSPTLCTAAGTFTFTAGTLTLNNNTLSTGIFSSSNSNTRAISFGSGNIALTSVTAATTILVSTGIIGFSWTGTGGFTRNQAATASIGWGTLSGGTAARAINFTVTAGASQLTINSGSYINNLIFTGSTCTVTSSNVNIAGNLTLATGGTYTSLTKTFINTSTVTSSGRTHGNTTINAVTVTLAGAMTLGTANTLTLTAGTLDLANFTLSCGIFSSSNSNTRAVSFGSGNIALTSTTASALVLNIDVATNFTWTGTGGFTRNQAATASVSFSGATGGTTANAPNLTVNAGASALNIVINSWFKNLIFTGSTCTVTTSNVNIAGNLTLASGGTYTSVIATFRNSGTITSATKTLGNTTINGAGITVTLADAMTVATTSTTTLTAGTLDLAGFTLSTGIFSASGTSTRAIAFGSGNIALTSTTAGTTVLSMATVVGFTWTGTGGFTRNMAATATVNFGATSGGTTSNAPNLTVNAGASNLSIVTFSWFEDLVFTGSTCSVSGGTVNIAGNLTLASGGTYTLVEPRFRAGGTLTSSGKTLGSTGIQAPGATVTLADALTLVSGQALTLTSGGFNAANFNVTAGAFSSSNSSTRTLDMGSGTWTISNSGATAWNTATTTGMTLNPSTSTISMTSASAKTFAGGGLTYYNLNQGGAGALTISGSNTFNNITDTVQPSTVTFTAGTTQTVSNFDLAGTAGNLVTINSSTPGSQFTLSKASGTVNAQYLSIQDSNATGGAVWYADATNVDGGNNTGWLGFAVAATGNMFMMFLP